MNEIKTILLVDDSPGDVRLTREAFRAVDKALRLHVAADGVEAISFLRRKGRHAYARRPDLILLDLNLPRINGYRVLAEIKQDDKLKTIPTVVLTALETEANVDAVYQLRANCYLTKPMEFEAFECLVKSISHFWLKIVRLPPPLQAA
jgi:two-component system, chemotaxis family, response regulator Rcp1